MSLLHGRWRRRTALLAAGALDEAGSRQARAHLERCAACARELAASRAALDLVAADPVRAAEAPIPLGALVARVRARLDEPAPARALWRPGLAFASAVAAIGMGVLLARLIPAPRTEQASLAASTAPVGGEAREPAGADPIPVPPDALRRIERTLERERAARYLSEAQDVLVTVAAVPARCTRRHDAVEVGEEAERSRELLARRRLFVDMDASATVAARGVLDDVEEMLREVAALDPCARPQDLEAIRGEIARRHLLLKIDLVTRELQG